MENECNKHPLNFDGYSPKKFAQKFVRTNYFYQEECFKYIVENYKKEIEGDKKRNRIQLVEGLEIIVDSILNGILDGFGKVGKACKNYMSNPFEK